MQIVTDEQSLRQRDNMTELDRVLGRLDLGHADDGGDDDVEMLDDQQQRQHQEDPIDEVDEDQAKEAMLTGEAVVFLGNNPGSAKVKRLRSQLQDGCFPKMGVGRRSSAQKKDLQNKKIRAMNIPSARLQLQQASPANIKSRSQYESTRPVQKPRNRFPALKQALMAHIKENPTKLIGYSLKECEAFQEKYP